MNPDRSAGVEGGRKPFRRYGSPLMAGGVGMSMHGMLLDWMQDRKSVV